VLAAGHQFGKIDAGSGLIVRGLGQHRVDELPQGLRQLLIRQEFPGEKPRSGTRIYYFVPNTGTHRQQGIVV
jgi:hypothetical protein